MSGRSGRAGGMDSQGNVLVGGRLVSDTEWHTWRKRGLGVREIAEMLGVSVGRAGQASKAFRDAGIDDPLYHKLKPGLPGALDTATDVGAYVLGILWGILSPLGDEGYWVRHRDKWYIDTVRDRLGITAAGHGSYSNTGDQWRLKITRAVDVTAVKRLLDAHGWTARNSPERHFPVGSLNEQGFVRAWVELHSSADIARVGRGRKPTPRLRIYGNVVFMEEINQLLSSLVGVSERTIQKTPNETTKALYYTGSSFCAILEWLYHGSELSNPEAREKLLKCGGISAQGGRACR